MRLLLLAFALVAMISGEGPTHAQGAAKYDDDIQVIVNALAGEQVILNGFAKGFAEMVGAKPGIQQMEQQHPGFRRALESKIVSTAGDVLRQRYPEIKEQLEGVARDVFRPGSAKIASVYLMSSAGKRFLTAWANDAEPRLPVYWDRYISQYGEDVPADIRRDDKEFASSPAFRDLAQVNARMAWPLTQWTVKAFQPDLIDKIPVVIRETAVEYGVCPNVGCEQK